MKKQDVRSFLLSCLFWFIPGILSGVSLAVFISISEYNMASRLAESVLEEQPLPALLKNTMGEKADKADKASHGDKASGAGALYLEKYGYSRLGRAATHLPESMGISLFLFEIAGGILFLRRKREERYDRERIYELTEYLKAAGRGEAKALTRREDAFSHLEDEIYKTVIMLAGTKEEAVKDHEILAARIADIAHQLKTPLTSMSLMTELIEPYQGEEEKEYMDRLKGQVDRLKRLVDALLSLAKLDSHTIEFDRKDTEIKGLAEEAVQPLKDMMERKRIRLEMWDAEDEDLGIQVKLDAQWTAEALLNLVKNCAEHTPENGRIFLYCEQNPLYTELRIEDEGPGFSRKDLPHIFERFYRGEQADKESVGIGLALARLIIEKQNGQIHAENTADGHARFCIRFFR